MLKRVRRAAGSVVRRSKRFIETRLHPGRYRESQKRLQVLPRPQSILVICYGNVCRSPYLEAVLQKALPDIEVTSAGFVGAGRGVPPHSMTLAGQRGLDLSRHKSRLISSDILSDGDLLLVMDANQAKALSGAFGVPAEKIIIAGDLDPEPGHGRTVHDPWSQPIEVFAKSFDRLDRIAAEITRLIGPSR